MKVGLHARNGGSTPKGMVGLHGQESTFLNAKDAMHCAQIIKFYNHEKINGCIFISVLFWGRCWLPKLHTSITITSIIICLKKTLRKIRRIRGWIRKKWKG
jgi:hypothetical protein